MKAFLSIVAAAVLVFLGGAMLEEREVFMQPWFASAASKPLISEAEKKAASDALYLHFKIAQHLHATSGDLRFAERLPASQPLVEEVSREVAYLRSHHVIEEPMLQRLEITGIETGGIASLELTTREFWVTRSYLTTTGEVLSTRSFVVKNRYRMSKDAGRWIVTAWDPVDDEETSR